MQPPLVAQRVLVVHRRERARAELGIAGQLRPRERRPQRIRALLGFDLTDWNHVSASREPAARIDHVVNRAPGLAVDDEAVERAKVLARAIVEMDVVLARFGKILRPEKAQARAIARRLLE